MTGDSWNHCRGLDMDMTGLIFALISAAPFIVFLTRISRRQYGGLLGNIWNRYGEPGLDRISRRFVCAGIYAGLFAGFGSTYFVLFLNKNIFGSEMLLFTPAQPVSWTLQMAFIQAGLIEEAAKCGFALLLCFLMTYNNKSKDKNSRLFFENTVFVCTAVGLGFAIRENIDYISIGLGTNGIIPVLLGRTMASIAHMMFSLNFGLYLSSATSQNWKSRAASGLLTCVMLHGIYDFFAFPPVLFSSILTIVFLMLMIFFIIRRLFQKYPGYKPRYPGFGNHSRLTNACRGLDNNKTDSTMVQNPFHPDLIDSIQIAKINQGTISMNADPQVTNNEFFCDVIPGVAEVSADYIKSFVKYEDTHLNQQKRSNAGFLMAELASVLGLGSRVAMNLDEESFRGEVPVNFSGTWSQMEAILSLEINSTRQADFVWDSSIFARDASSHYLELARAGVDLEKLSAFRVLEYRNVNFSGSHLLPYLYISQGLEILYGHEFYFVSCCPAPSIRWFLLRLASFHPDQAPWIRPFIPMFVKNSFDLGEPRGWWKGFVAVQLFGTMNEIYKNVKDKLDSRNSSNPPLAMLFLSVSDLKMISNIGMQGYFQYLEKNDISRHNDLKRPVTGV